RLLIHGAQHLHFRPGTGIRLKIGEITPGAVHQRGLISELLRDGVVLLRFISKGGYVTESAAAPSDSAIAIRATETAMQRQFMDLLPVTTSEIATKHID